MPKRFGIGTYQYEVVENWPKIEIKGVAADVACDSAGRVYVGVRNPSPDGTPPRIMPGVGRVLVLDREGSLLAEWDTVFSSPHGVWVNGDDEVFLADTGLHTITKHAPSGEVLMTLGTPLTPGAPGAPFNMPTRAKQAPNGDIFVSDGYGQNRIHRFSSKGEHILSWGKGNVAYVAKVFHGAAGEPSSGQGEFYLPHDVMVDWESRVVVMDRENSRWQVFTMDGVFVSECEGVNRPNDVAVDADGVLHIVSGPGVEIRQPDGALVGRWGEKGSEPGQFANGPHGVWMDREGDLYIAEVGGFDRLQKFRRV